MSDFESPLDKIIREARENGAFQDLPGKGKPLQWQDESMIPEDQRMAQRILKSNGFTLDWIEMGQELERDYAALCGDLDRAQAEHAAGKLDAAGWRAARAAFERKVRELNQRIIGYNLRVPHEHFQRMPFSTKRATGSGGTNNPGG
jgi:DnaJ homolog subfamily C member 28